MNWITDLFRQKKPATRTTTFRDPLVIPRPRLRFLNVIGPAAASRVTEDMAALSPLFADAKEIAHVEPCDVLIVYIAVNDDGSALKRIVVSSHAPIVVVASENSGEAYLKATAGDLHKFTNLVLTIARNDSSFAHFFVALFAKMFDGTTMPVAWVELAPQAPGASHADAPEAIFACGAGHIRFQA